jgi:cullin-4
MVQRLLKFKALADMTISSSFLDEKVTASRGPNASASTSLHTKQPNNEFVYALSDAFTMGFKARRSAPAEMIAKYLDKAMRRGQGGTSDEQFEALLNSVLALYRFTDDKDVFRSFYHRSLAKRLLLQKSASDDFEASMLKKLKERRSFYLVGLIV